MRIRKGSRRPWRRWDSPQRGDPNSGAKPLRGKPARDASSGLPGPWLLDRAAGDTRDETIEEEIIGDRHGNAGDQRAGHDLAPEEDVATHEIGRHAECDRLLVRRRHEC